MTLAVLDVHYRAGGARAACVVAASWSSKDPLATYVADIGLVQEYVPGEFYRRELPCLLQVLRSLPASPSVVVIDGYVWLPDSAKPGLGAHLYEALGGRTPVVGVAKTAFLNAESSALVAQVRRGTSKNPLFVTAAGVEVAAAGAWVHTMAGMHRIPTLLAMADRLSRSDVAFDRDAPKAARPSI